jgi:hypothetical protein
MIKRPAGVGDIDYVRGDPLALRFFFHASSGQTPVNVSSSVFTVRCYDDADQDLAVPELNVADADAGFVQVYFSAAQISALPRYAHLSIRESGRWGRMILTGRLTEGLLLGGTFAVVPEIEDQIEVLIPVAIADSSIPDGTTRCHHLGRHRNPFVGEHLNAGPTGRHNSRY